MSDNGMGLTASPIGGANDAQTREGDRLLKHAAQVRERLICIAERLDNIKCRIVGIENGDQGEVPKPVASSWVEEMNEELCGISDAAGLLESIASKLERF